MTLCSAHTSAASSFALALRSIHSLTEFRSCSSVVFTLKPRYPGATLGATPLVPWSAAGPGAVRMVAYRPAPLYCRLSFMACKRLEM